MVLGNMVNMQLMMFALAAIGFLVRKKNIVGTEGRKNMVDLCIYVTLPFNIFQSFLVKWEMGMLKAFLVVLTLSVGYNVVSVVMSKVLFNQAEAEKRKPLKYATIVSNGGFLGNPVIEGLYGSAGLFYASVFMLPVRVVMWTIGTSCFIKKEKEHVLKKILTHPCIVAIYLGLLAMLLQMDFPVFMNKTISGLSGCNTPLSMMLIGMMLAEMNPKGLVDKTMVFYASVRLLVIPALALLITAPLPLDPLLRGITVVIAGMPTPVTAALLSSKYGGDETYATGMIFLTTILSLFTLPLFCLFL